MTQCFCLKWHNERSFSIGYRQYCYRLAFITVITISMSVGHCPVYNTVAKKMNSVICSGKNCPKEVYRSDAVYNCMS